MPPLRWPKKHCLVIKYQMQSTKALSDNSIQIEGLIETKKGQVRSNLTRNIRKISRHFNIK